MGYCYECDDTGCVCANCGVNENECVCADPDIVECENCSTDDDEDLEEDNETMMRIWRRTTRR